MATVMSCSFGLNLICSRCTVDQFIWHFLFTCKTGRTECKKRC